ncbi:DUF3088 domain-containing protein [Thiovibrio sp. JS02]
MAKHTLFTLTPWIEDGRGPYYCPDCAVVEGFLHYSPQIREKIVIVQVNFPRPRPEIVELLGADNQSCPVLVLAEEAGMTPGAKTSFATGRKFINNGLAICNFLAEAYNGIKPHP